MTTNTSTFSFQEEETILQTSLDSTTTMRIAKSGPSIARVYFVDSHTHREVPIPIDLTIYDDTNHVIVSKLYSTESFVLHWGDNYTIEYDNEVIMEFVTQRQWTVTSPATREIVCKVK